PLHDALPISPRHLASTPRLEASMTYELAARHLPLLQAGRQLPCERGADWAALAVQRLAQDSGRLGAAGDVGHGSRGQGGVREAQEREGSSMSFERVEIGNAVLYRADARDVVAGLEADAVITDPVWPNCPPGFLPG